MSEEEKAKPSILISLIRVGVLLGGMAVLAYVFVIRPNMIEMQFKSKRSELPVNLKAIQTTMLAYKDMDGKYISVKPYPKKVGTEPQVWIEAESGNFQKIGYAPFSQVYGSYWVEVTETDFTAYGISDIDGDGVYATYVATSKENPKALNSAF